MHEQIVWMVCVTVTVVLTFHTLHRYIRSGKQCSAGLLIFRLVALPALATSALAVAVN